MRSIITFLLFIGISFSAVAGISPSEKKALVKLYHATSGEQWTKSWDLNAPVETWHGVSIEGNHVVALNLAENNLSGKLPKQIGNLTHLKTLNLFRNKLSGEIPNSIGKLKELQIINLSFNQLTGKIP